MKKRNLFITAGILLSFAIFLRIYRIATLPLDMHIDEAGLGLNAWSIANFGTDRYSHFLPVCPSNFYGEQSAFYTYFCALLVKFFGLNMYTLRLPGVIMGILTVIFGSLLMKEKWGDKGFLTGLVTLGIFPYFIMNCRFALDCNAMLGTLTIALYCLVRTLKKQSQSVRNTGTFCKPSYSPKKHYGWFALTGVLFGITLYTYIIAAIVVAVFCIGFGIYYLFYQKEARFLRFKQLVCIAVPLGIMAIPLILVVCVNYLDWDAIVTPFFSIPKLIVNRTEEVGFTLADLPGKLRSLLYPLTSDGKYGSSDRFFTMYPVSLPFIAIGGIYSLYVAAGDCKRRLLSLDICMLLITFAEIIMFLLCGQYNYHINGIFIALAYFCINGIFCVLQWIKKKNPRRIFACVLLCLYAISFAGFAKEYYGADTSVAYQVFGGVDEALSLLTDEEKSGEIYIMDEVGEFYFLSNPVTPDIFAANCNELGYLADYQNLHFHEPETYNPHDVYICNKASGRHYTFSDESVTGYAYQMLETEHYYIFY